MRVRRLVQAGAAIALAGCAAGGRFDPPAAEGPIEDASLRMGAAPGAAAHGRDVYVTRCAKCHSYVPPADHTEAQWNTILPRMSRKAKLGDNDAAALRAYVLAAHRVATAK